MIANILTGSRIAGALILLLFPAFSIPFYMIYTYCGLSDILDGAVARYTGTASEFGAKLDSISDIIFWLIVFFKIYTRFFEIVGRVEIVIVLLIAIMRIAAYIMGYVRFHRFAGFHTLLNKMTGLILFGFIYADLCGIEKFYIEFGLIIASLAAIEEMLCNIVLKEYNPDVVSVIPLIIGRNKRI